MLMLIATVLLIASFIYFVGLPTTVVLLIAYLVGLLLCSFSINEKLRLNAIKVYNSLFTLGGLYLLLCYLYMIAKDYTFLFASDTPGYYLPLTKAFIGDSFKESMSLIWRNYELLGYFKPGYFTYTVLFGYINQWVGGELYVSLMISTLLIYSISGVVFFRLLTLNNFDNGKSVKYAVIVFCCSIILFYSSQILRDIHILLIYLLVILYTFKPISFANIARMIFLTVICAMFRIESALFLVMVLLSYTYVSSKQKNKSQSAIILLVLTLLIAGIYFFNDFITIYDENRANYVDDISTGSGVIALLQRIPIIGDILSVIYNFLQPMPCWARMSPPVGTDMYEEYNIMGFPRIFASFFNCLVLIVTGIWVFGKHRATVWRGLPVPLKMHICLGVIFLLLQSAVIDQRRLMAYYCIFFILFFAIMKTYKRGFKQNLILGTLGVYSIIQILTFTYLGL